jgi:hypothetical protein
MNYKKNFSIGGNIIPESEMIIQIWTHQTSKVSDQIRYESKQNTTNQCFGSASGMIRIQSGYCIRIQIRNPDADPGGQKGPTKIRKLQFFFNKILICFSSVIFL